MSIAEITDRMDRSFDYTETIGVSSELAHAIHLEKGFFAGAKFTLPASGTYWLTFTTDSKSVHFQERDVSAYDSAGATVDVDITLHEGVTTDEDGDAITIFNADRSSSVVSTSVMRQNETITNAGTELPKCNILRADKKFLSKDGSGIEYIMKGSTVYGLKCVNNVANDVKIKFGWNWSEL